MSIPVLPPSGAASQALADEFNILLRGSMANSVDPGLSERLRALAEVADPPSNNMGGTYPNTPYFLPHSEKSGEKVVNKTKLDWLAASSGAGADALRLVLEVIWPSVKFERNTHGMKGYPNSDSIIVDGVQYGQLGYGASHGRDFISITGTGCKTLTDELVEVFYEALKEVDATLSRLDICLDLYNGERTWDHAKWSCDKGAFRRPRANKDPEFKEVTATNNGQNMGRTLYVGLRSGEVMGRIYEKGLEVFAKMPEEFRLMSEAREVMSGSKPEFADTWLRLEAEYKRQSKDRPLPLEMMLERDRYFAGAYPYFADALGRTDGVRPKTMITDQQIVFAKMADAAQRSYGSFVYSLTEIGFSNEEIVKLLSSGRNNEKLLKSGLLAIMKKAADEARLSDPDFDVPF